MKTDAPVNHDDRLLTIDAVAKLIMIDPPQIRRLVRQGSFMPPIRIGQLRRWSLKEVQEWIAIARSDREIR